MGACGMRGLGVRTIEDSPCSSSTPCQQSPAPCGSRRSPPSQETPGRGSGRQTRRRHRGLVPHTQRHCRDPEVRAHDAIRKILRAYAKTRSRSPGRPSVNHGSNSTYTSSSSATEVAHIWRLPSERAPRNTAQSVLDTWSSMTTARWFNSPRCERPDLAFARTLKSLHVRRPRPRCRMAPLWIRFPGSWFRRAEANGTEVCRSRLTEYRQITPAA